MAKSRNTILTLSSFLTQFLLVSCANASHLRYDLGLIPIGGKPTDKLELSYTDCNISKGDFSDCKGVDLQGREYVFFAGALSSVSAEINNVHEDINLPSGVTFGEKTEIVIRELSKYLNVKFDRYELKNKSAIYVTDYAVLSSVGVRYYIEVKSNASGEFVGIAARTDY